MSSWKHVLSTLAFSLAALLHPNMSGAVSFVRPDGVDRAFGVRAEPVFFHHSPRGISYYCYPRNYWWFYRPYTTAGKGYARCMPYFHYPPQAYRGWGGGGQMK
jgi:hypothetical protein